jgi:hypothetical protein
MRSSKLLYGNCVVKYGELTMFRCDADRMYWYLDKGLANVESSDPPVIQLTFKPKGPGHWGDPYFLQEFKNQCVVCGTKDGLSHHHIVPYCYRRYFPRESYETGRWFYDVLLLCVRCHDRYERQASWLKEEIAAEYGVSASGVSSLSSDEIMVSKVGAALYRHGHEMPKDRREHFENILKAYLGKEEITRDDVYHVWKGLLESNQVTPAGGIVVSKVADVDEFAVRWRRHFMQHMKPKFLPEGWNTERRIYSEKK